MCGSTENEVSGTIDHQAITSNLEIAILTQHLQNAES